jgi:hypothetical protein
MKNVWGGVPRLVIGACLLATAWGCSTTKLGGNPIGNQRPQVQLTARPQPGDSVYFKVRLQWTASDEDGRVDYFIYTVDPPLQGDTTWTRIDQNETTIFFKSGHPDPSLINPLSNGNFPASPVISSNYHEFVIKAVDNEGAFSAPGSIAFNSRTVAPVTTITTPSPGKLVTRSTPPSVHLEWRGVDPDREGVGVAGPPRLYKFKLVSQSAIQQTTTNPGAPPSPQDIQDFFTQSAPNFSDWDSTSADTTFHNYEGVTPGQVWYFAVVSFDIAGAYEPRFNLDNNVLRFKPTTELQAPPITVFNSFFVRSQGARGSFDLSESRVVHLEIPEGQPIQMNWVVDPDAEARLGAIVAGFRWEIDPIDGDIFNETPRDNDSQTYRWSSWSLTEMSTVVGPYKVTGNPDSTFHRLYIEARDNTGAVSIMVVELEVVKARFKDPNLAENILFFDDFRGDTDRADHKPYSNFPIESALDTLFYAVGGFPYTGMPPAEAISKPGIFSGYFSDAQGRVVSDTIDYRFAPTAGLPLSVMDKYRAVVWYTGNKDASRLGTKFSSSPEGALRFINDPGQLNTLAVYLSQGGKAFLFGNGVLESIAAGYAGRFGGNGPAPYPWRTSDNKADRTHILFPGNFMYDYLKIRNGMDIADQGGAGDPLSILDNFGTDIHTGGGAFIPYLPQFQCAGAPYPPNGWTGYRTATCDPRVGPASVNNSPTWDGLPILPMQTEFNFWPTQPPQSIAATYISIANSIPASEAEFDTLYLGQCLQQNLRPDSGWPDGKPVWFHVTDHTGAGWELDWTNIPIWYLDRTQLQIAVGKILGKFGFQKNTNPRTQTGPGGVTQGTDFAGRPIE